MPEPGPALPSEEKLRELTARPDLPPEEANRYGDLFLEAGQLAQAMMFYERSKDPERLARVKKIAVEKGDAFFLHAVTRLAPDLVTPEEWKAAGDRASQAGKFLFARDCYEKAGDAERAQAAREAWLKIFAA